MPPLKYPTVALTAEESASLAKIIGKGVGKARVITRARVLLKLAEGHTIARVCEALDVSQTLVSKTKRRFSEGGVDAALEELARPGAIPKLNAKQKAMVTAIACSEAPEGHDHWALRLLAGKVVELGFAESFTHEGVRMILKKTNSSHGRFKNGASRRSTKSS